MNQREAGEDGRSTAALRRDHDLQSAGQSPESVVSDQSMETPILFKAPPPEAQAPWDHPAVASGQSVLQRHLQHDLASTFRQLEKNIASHCKRELEWFQKVLNSDETACTDGQRVDEGQRMSSSSREAVLKITLDVLRTTQQETLADLLQKKLAAPVCRRELQTSLKKKFQCVFEGIAKAGNPTLLNQIFTELIVTEGGPAEVDEEHEVRQIEYRKPPRQEATIRCDDFFKPSPGRAEPIRTVMTKGVAGIGKTVLTQKFALDWAEGKANQDFQFVLPFTFRELNVLNEKKCSLVELVHLFFPETKTTGSCRFEHSKVVFIFDGLDECRLSLDFINNKILTDVTESAAVDVLLTNLIRGKLLPSAHVWITTRPAAANQIPPVCVDMVTEVRGFSDPQKEEYLRKRFRDEEQASRIISHIKTSRTLHIMCYIPIFCWITATVLEDMLKTRDVGELPKTLTEMYIHFLMVQLKLKAEKYDRGAETDPLWSPDSREMVASLGKLAFEQLQNGNLIFYEADLMECGINIRVASVFSGVFTQIFREEKGLFQDKMFCFVHLSVQEFLAALHVHQTFIDSGVNLLEEQSNSWWSNRTRAKSTQFYQSAVNLALQSPNGHLDLFLRFLLGLSLPTNQTLLRGLLKQPRMTSQTNWWTVKYIKGILRKNPSKRIFNLFHCLNELRDHSLEEEIQQYLSSGNLSTDKLSPGQWSALIFILLSSEKVLDVFDLRKYGASDEALLRLLPVVKASSKALMSSCNLTSRSCEVLSSVLRSRSSCLRELDLSSNDLQDSGLILLSDGLKSPHCTLESLRLSGCLVTGYSCTFLALALSSNPSHLRELDLSYNHLGDSGASVLSALLEDPHSRLDTLRMDSCGEQRLIPGVWKFGCRLTLDPDTAYRKLQVSQDNRRVMKVWQRQPYPDLPQRFDRFSQVLSTSALTGRCFWAVDWNGAVNIAVTYGRIRRKGNSADCRFGMNKLSWCLSCSLGGYSAWHDDRVTLLRSSRVSSRVAVYLDHPAGMLSFYNVSPDHTLTHLHTFNTTFTEPLYAGFGSGIVFGIPSFGSMSLCEL